MAEVKTINGLGVKDAVARNKIAELEATRLHFYMFETEEELYQALIKKETDEGEMISVEQYNNGDTFFINNPTTPRRRYYVTQVGEWREVSDIAEVLDPGSGFLSGVQIGYWRLW